MFTSEFLYKYWNRALRQRVLYTALDKEERGYLYLTMRAIDRVRSIAVGKILVPILRKLRDALKSPFVRMMESYGLDRARKVAGQAVALGNEEADGWARSLSFIRYLTLIEFNKSTGWG